MATAGPQKKSLRFLLAGVLLCLLSGLWLQHSAAGAWLDAKQADWRTAGLREYFPTDLAHEVIVVGIDEATVEAFPEPRTLWHKHWGDFLKAMQAAGASSAGLDIVMPERSFNALVPGYDEALMMGMLAARKDTPLVFAITLTSQGEARPLYRKFELLAGDKGMGMALFPRDVDQRVRRFDERLSDDGTEVPTLVGQMARSMKLVPKPGYIDFSQGKSFRYVPLHEVVSQYREGQLEALQKQFAGKPVLLGTVLPDEDRLLLPVNLAAWEDNGKHVHGVLLHAQTLRAFMNQGLVQPMPNTTVWLGILLAALLWCWRSGLPAKLLVLFALLLAVSGLAMWLFRQGSYLPTSAILLTAILALLGRAGFDAFEQLKERRMLKSAFGNSVSPNVMEEILSGKIKPELGGTRKFVAILFSDIRGFTTRSESMTPEAGIHLLNRYFECVVERIHANGGAVINFMGDGIMAIFGEPKPLENPCASGFAAAKAMQEALAKFNEQLKREGITPIEIGVGVHAGEVVIGHMGSSNRNDYTAIGDAANVASRVEGLTKDVGYGIVCSKVIVDALADSQGFVALGPQPIKGHTPVEVYGWGKL